MKTTLLIPDSEASRERKARPLALLYWSRGVLRYANGRILDGAAFRELRDTLGAVIETTYKARICRALGVTIDEPGIKRV
jgi:hypothetical protein